MTSGVPWHMRGVRPEADRFRARSRAPVRDVGRRVAGYRHCRISPERGHRPDGATAFRFRRPRLRTNRLTPGPGAAIRTRRPYAAGLELFGRHRTPRRARPPGRPPEPGRRPAAAITSRPKTTALIADVLSRLDRKIDRLGAIGGTTGGMPAPFERAPSIAPSIGHARRLDRPGAGRDRGAASACSTAARPRRRWSCRAPRPRACPTSSSSSARSTPASKTCRPCGDRRRGRDLARRSRRDRHDAQGGHATAGDRGAGSRDPVAGLAYRQRTPCRRRWRSYGARRARPRRSPRRAARPHPRRKPGRLQTRPCRACRRRSIASPAPARTRRRSSSSRARSSRCAAWSRMSRRTTRWRNCPTKCACSPPRSTRSRRPPMRSR